jgi:hypothetical protein
MLGLRLPGVRYKFDGDDKQRLSATKLMRYYELWREAQKKMLMSFR